MIELPELIPINDVQLNRPTILLLSDDLNAPSGIGTMSREIVFKTADKFNWIQIASMVTHPEAGKVFDISTAVNQEMNIENSSVKLYPYNGYGDQNILRYILDNEKVDGILHFTDPRYWTWLYAMEHEIRSQRKIPIMYYSIWDDLPYPHWNLAAYSSCDLLMAINKQTHLIHTKVLEFGGYTPFDITGYELPDFPKPSDTTYCDYIPHGIDSSIFRPIEEGDKDLGEYLQFVDTFKGQHPCEFILFWNNRNIRRKQPGDVIFSYKLFCDSLPPEEAKKCILFLHTQPRDGNGTDLLAVKDNICPNYEVVFSSQHVSPKVLNYYYNISDVTLNIGSNEGFGLSSAESLMSGTPIINNVTGGLQDQMGFLDNDGNPYFPTEEVPSNHMKTYTEHGDWAYPVFPSNRSLQGSLETPYIFDDRVQPEDVAIGIKYWYNKTRDERKQSGKNGRNWMINTANMDSTHMCNSIAESMQLCIKNFQPKPSISMIKIQPKKQVPNIGISK